MKIAIVEYIDCVITGQRLLTWIFNVFFSILTYNLFRNHVYGKVVEECVLWALIWIVAIIVYKL
jgi:hypothetical protein